MSHHLRISEIWKLTFSKPLLSAKLSANKQVKINNSQNNLVSLSLLYAHFTDEFTGSTEVSMFTYSKAEFRFSGL